MKCPILSNRFFTPESVHGLLGNSAINFLALYPFSCLISLIKRGRLQKIAYILLLSALLFTLIESTNVTFDRRLQYVFMYW